MKKVIIYLRGGDIQGASDVPPGFEVEVRDYDTDGTDQMVKRDEDGNAYLPLVIGGPMVRKRQPASIQTRYVRDAGELCPACGGNILEGRGFDDHGAEIHRGIVCVTCGAQWTEVFRLEKFCGLVKGSAHPGKQ